MGHPRAMRIAITGATGNVGTALVQALSDDGLHELVGVARRPPPRGRLSRFYAADVARDDLSEAFEGADAVVHLAWKIQPSRRRGRLGETNVLGTARVIQAAADARAGCLVVASSIGAYAPGAKDQRVDEAWPATGVPSSTYSVHKAAIERQLDVAAKAPARASHRAPSPRSHLPARISERAAAPFGVRLSQAGCSAPAVCRSCRTSMDCGSRQCTPPMSQTPTGVIPDPASGAYNVAADPVLDVSLIAQARHARIIRLPRGLARRAFSATYAAHLHPSEPGWLDLALDMLLIDSSRIREQLGWEPRHSAIEAVEELLDGIADGAGAPTPPLLADSFTRRLREIAGGIGARAPSVPRRSS